jgi:phosphatidylethanolamine-binding protein (PEBP) family uncharacterized protein
MVLLALGMASAQDRAGGGAQAGGRGGRGGGGLAMLTVTSSSFADGAEIPAKYTGGQGTSPQLSWSGAPAGTASFVLIMHDVDVAFPAGGLNSDITHWVVWNIPANATRADVEKAMDGKIVARGAYVGRAKPAQ